MEEKQYISSDELNSTIIQKKIDYHPCYGTKNVKKHARVHLPVAPLCNIQCNYCDRQYDCVNESRPGVTSRVLKPNEVQDYLTKVTTRIPQIKVVGIAGPGDPLANPEEVLYSLELTKKYFPSQKLCLSTNGLMLPDYVKDLNSIGLEYITVTVNAVDPAIAQNIYAWVSYDHKIYSGKMGAELLLARQKEGIRKAAEYGLIVKINTILIPDINNQHIKHLASEVRELGADLLNLVPLIPIGSTNFASKRAPSKEELIRGRDIARHYINIMQHCQQCRADAVGLLGNDQSIQFKDNLHSNYCYPARKCKVTV